MTIDLKHNAELAKETAEFSYDLDSAVKGSLSFDQSYRVFAHVMAQMAKLNPYVDQTQLEAHSSNYFKSHEKEIIRTTSNLKPLTQLIAHCENYNLKQPEGFLEATKTARHLIEKGNARFYVMTQYYVFGIDELVQNLVNHKNPYNDE